MRFDASLQRLKKAVADLEKASKTAAKSKGKANAAQIDMFSFAPATPSNDIDVETLKKQLDDAISSVETLMSESA